MATANSFDLLVDDDNDDLTQLLQKLPPPVKKSPAAAPAAAAAAPAAKSAKLPSKPLPPAQAVREGRTDGQREGGRTGGRGTGRGRGARFGRDSADNENSFRDNNGFSSETGRPRGGRYGRESADNENSFSSNNNNNNGFSSGTGRPRGERYGRNSADNENSFSSDNGFSSGYRQPVEGETERSSGRRGYGGPRGAPRGGRRDGYNNGEVAESERPRRPYERHSGTGRGNEYVKRDGAGRGNWGTPVDDLNPGTEEPVHDGGKDHDAEKQLGKEDVSDANKEGDANKENPVTEPEEKKEPEVKEMTLEEYEKILEEKRKALLALKPEERKVNLDKDFETMQLLSSKKNEEEIFVKLGADKEKHKEAAEKEERARKVLNLNEFLKPAEGERYYGAGSRGGRGRGARGGNNGFVGGRTRPYNVATPVIEDVAQFPALSAN